MLDLEMLAQQPDIDTLVVAIGGGGLISGVATAARSIKPDIEVIGVQTERFPAVWNAIHGEQRESAQAMIADGIAVKSPGALTLPLIRERVNNVLLVSDGDIEQAILMLLEIEKTVVEGAGAVGLAALADAAALLGKLGANIDEVQHQRAFTSLSAERAQIEVVGRTRGMAHIEQILTVMRAQGYSVGRIA